MKKIIIVGLIFLLLVITWSPVINASRDEGVHETKQDPEDRFIRVVCSEYQSDGSIEKISILLLKSDYLEMRQAFLRTTSMEEKLGVYQRYGVIPSTVTIQSMKEKFDSYLLTTKMNTSSIKKYTDQWNSRMDIDVVLNTNCKVYAVCQYGIHLILGMSPITRFWNMIAYWLWFFWVDYYHLPELLPPLYLPGFDLIDFNVNAFSIVQVTEGDRPDDSANLELSWMIMGGFVGYYVEYIPLPLVNYGNEYIGYTAYIQAVGRPHEYK